MQVTTSTEIRWQTAYPIAALLFLVLAALSGVAPQPNPTPVPGSVPEPNPPPTETVSATPTPVGPITIVFAYDVESIVPAANWMKAPPGVHACAAIPRHAAPGPDVLPGAKPMEYPPGR